MSEPVRCPSCSMTAERGDHRQWIPTGDHGDRRRCRNCGATVQLHDAARSA